MKLSLQAQIKSGDERKIIRLYRHRLAAPRAALVQLMRRIFATKYLSASVTTTSTAVAVIGGFALMAVASAQTITATGNLAEASMRHTATVLADGRVLLVKTDGHAMRFDPGTNQWSAVTGPSTASTEATATRLPDGTVLLAGGYASGGAVLARAERYNPITGAWSAALAMPTARTLHTATLMADGGVLMIGGSPQNVTPLPTLASVDRFDPVTGAWVAGSALPTGRAQHSATRLASGDVIVLGGLVAGSASNTCLRLPVGGANWLPCAAMTKQRAGHRATLLADGRIFVTGGATTTTGNEEIYAPTTDTWASTSLPARTETNHIAFELTPGVMLVWGGAPWFFYTPGSDPAPQVKGAVTYAIASGAVATLFAFPSRAGQTATPLVDGRILISGGFSDYTATASLGTFYNPIALASSYTLPIERLPATVYFPARSGALPWSPAVGESYRVYASVGPASYGGATPEGTVVVSNGINSCTMTLGGSNPSCRLIAATAGSQSYSVSYSGDAIYAPRTIAVATSANNLLRIQRVGDVVGYITSNTGGIFGIANCGGAFGPFPDECDLSPAPGAAITLNVPTPVTGITFVGWQGACAGTAPTCSLVMPSAGSLAVKALFAPPTPTTPTPTPLLRLVVEGDNTVKATTDGALLTRFLRRVHGAALTASVLGANPTQTDATTLEDRLDAMAPLLDVDQNGVVDPDTDGVIIVRYMFGFRGSALTQNAIGLGARRIDPQLIAAALAQLIP